MQNKSEGSFKILWNKWSLILKKIKKKEFKFSNKILLSIKLNKLRNKLIWIEVSSIHTPYKVIELWFILWDLFNACSKQDIHIPRTHIT